MNQSKLESFIETSINTAIGYVVALISQLLVFPLVDIHVPLSTNLEIGAWFTVISVLRGYVIRRWFNARLKNAARRMAELGAQENSNERDIPNARQRRNQCDPTTDK